MIFYHRAKYPTNPVGSQEAKILSHPAAAAVGELVEVRLLHTFSRKIILPPCVLTHLLPTWLGLAGCAHSTGREDVIYYFGMSRDCNLTAVQLYSWNRPLHNVAICYPVFSKQFAFHLAQPRVNQVGRLVLKH